MIAIGYGRLLIRAAASRIRREMPRRAEAEARRSRKRNRRNRACRGSGCGGSSPALRARRIADLLVTIRIRIRGHGLRQEKGGRLAEPDPRGGAGRSDPLHALLVHGLRLQPHPDRVVAARAGDGVDGPRPASRRDHHLPRRTSVARHRTSSRDAEARRRRHPPRSAGERANRRSSSTRICSRWSKGSPCSSRSTRGRWSTRKSCTRSKSTRCCAGRGI